METLIIEAIYENGVLKPIQPLPLQEREHVRITVESPSNLVRATAGLIACTDTQLIERIALDAIEDI
ncbi:MAG TPA: antitoxin family protein [Pirellulales bacterium]